MLVNGILVVSEFTKTCLATFGVYKMLGKDKEVLYVGKAKNLKSRIASYARSEGLSHKNKQLIFHLSSIEVIYTNNEQEALILEINLIKQYKPRYNILLKDDKSFPYIVIEDCHEFPRIAKYRGVKNAKWTTFGPFASSSKADESMKYIQKAFLIRSCTDAFFKNRKRPCMLYDIKMCCGPCVRKIDATRYAGLVDSVKDFFRGKNVEMQARLAEQMRVASLAQNYEEAAFYRDRIRALSYVQTQQVAQMQHTQNADVITVLSHGNKTMLQIFFIRNGRNLGNKVYDIASTDESEVMQGFISKFYKSNNAPGEILINTDLADKDFLEIALKSLHGKSVHILKPTRGEKFELMKFCINNALNYISQKERTYKKYDFYINEMTALFGISTNVERVEIYDNSHVSGSYAIGAMVVATRFGLEKSAYKKYNINFTDLDSTQDDYYMLRQVLMRRFKHQNTNPGLIIIDGGKGHLNVAKQALSDIGINDIFIISIAKGEKRNSGEETIYDCNDKTYNLDKYSKTKQFLQILRDEAHRFVITAHRAKRIKKFTGSVLDKIPGIGEERKRLLLAHFGSVENIRNASVKSLENIESISAKIAQKIYEFFRKNL